MGKPSQNGNPPEFPRKARSKLSELHLIDWPRTTTIERAVTSQRKTMRSAILRSTSGLKGGGIEKTAAKNGRVKNQIFGTCVFHGICMLSRSPLTSSKIAIKTMRSLFCVTRKNCGWLK